MDNSPWNQANADALTVDSWGGATAVTAFPPLVPVTGTSNLYQCPTHPQHKTPDPASFCPFCESAWDTQRQDLQAKRQSVEEQLENLQASGSDSAAAILQDLQFSMKEWKPQPEEAGGLQNGKGSSPPANHHQHDGYRPSNDFFGRTHPNNSHSNNNSNFNSNNNNSTANHNNIRYQSYPPNGRHHQEQPPPPPPPPQNAGMPPPSFFSPFYDQGGGGPGGPPQMQAFAMQLHSMQRMQDWLLWQKEQECQSLRASLEEIRTEVQQLRVDKALLQEKLYQQEERMKHELKLIKLAALQQQQQQMRQKSTGGSGAGSSKLSHSFASGSDRYQGQAPIVLLPEHMRSNTPHSVESSSSQQQHRASNPTQSANSSQATPKQTAQTSGLGSPSRDNSAAVATPGTNLSLASYQSGESPMKLPDGMSRTRSTEESVKSSHSNKSRGSRESRSSQASNLVRTVKPPNSWINNPRSSNNSSNSTNGKSPEGTNKSGPVDTDDWINDTDQNSDDHEPVGIQQHPDIHFDANADDPVVGGSRHDDDDDGDEDGDKDDHDDRDDDTFEKLFQGDDDNELPQHGNDLFPPDDLEPLGGGLVVQQDSAPIKVLNMAPTATRDEISALNSSFATKVTVESPRKQKQQQSSWTPPPQPSPRGVSFPDSPMDDDNASLGQTVASSTFGEDRQKVVDQVILDPYGDKGTYSGIILRSTGMPHGPGRMIYQEDRRTYDGEWRHGRWHGYGRATFANGDTYDGEYRFDQRHGRGRYQWSDGRVYDGMFREDRRHGRGTFTWPDGAIYEGDFRSGQREGQGSYQFSDGGRYEGSWKDGRYNGYGVCKWEDGRCYKGEWLNGMAHGKGIETFADGTVRHDGQWIEDEPVP